jgi:hypothetical protein
MARAASTQMKKIVCILLLLAAPVSLTAAERDELKPAVAIFTVEHASLQLNALSQKSVQSIDEVFDRLGRFQPIDDDAARTALDAQPAVSKEDPYRAAATALGAGLYVVVTVTTMGNTIVGTVEIFPIDTRYSRLRQTVSVTSLIMMNIPLKLAREIAILHRDLPVEADIKEHRDGLALLTVGQWHGLAPGVYRTESGQAIVIRNTNRYRSLAALPPALEAATHLTIQSYPATRAIVREIGRRIEYQTTSRYSLAETGMKNPEKKFAEGMCLINPGANACLPGYGAFLATSYMGFKNTKPSIPGIIFSTSLFITHLILPEAMGKFKINFFPGVMDSDKTPALNNLQIYLWSTLPLTASAAFLDQLANQFALNSVLPPFFMNKNETALVLSVMVPGGGMFYKGWRLPGWGFYLSEMFLAGFCVYRKDAPREVLYGGIALGGIKLIELFTAYFCPPAYEFYNIEMEGRILIPSLSMDVRPSKTGDPVYRLGASLAF